MVEQGWLRDVTRPLLIFCFIILDASWAHDGCSTFNFPSGSAQNKEESKREEGWPRWIKRAKLLQKSLVELHLAYYLELITWPRVAAREAGGSDFLAEHMATLYASSAVRVKESVEWVASRGAAALPGRLGGFSLGAVLMQPWPCMDGFLHPEACSSSVLYTRRTGSVTLTGPPSPFRPRRMSPFLLSLGHNQLLPSWCSLRGCVCPWWRAAYFALGLLISASRSVLSNTVATGHM